MMSDAAVSMRSLHNNSPERDVDQLGGHSKTFTGVNEAGSQHRTNIQLLSNLARISLLSLVSGDHGRRSDHERSNTRELGNHGIGKRKLVKTRCRIVAQVSETENRQTLLLLIRNCRERSFVNA